MNNVPDVGWDGPRPHSVAVVAMGASSSDYLNRAAQQGGRHTIADETWAINAMGGIIDHDRLFAMDDMSELVHDSRKHGKKVATGMLDWMPRHPGPIYVPVVYGQIPGAVRYPFEGVLDSIGFPYLNNSVAYAVAYAVYLGVGSINLYGCDFSYPGDNHASEAGRGNVEWLLGIAGERGIHIEVSESTTLLDAYKKPSERLYGFTEPVVPNVNDNGEWQLTYPEKNGDEAPTKPTEAKQPTTEGSGLDKVPRVIEAA